MKLANAGVAAALLLGIEGCKTDVDHLTDAATTLCGAGIADRLVLVGLPDDIRIEEYVRQADILHVRGEDTNPVAQGLAVAFIPVAKAAAEARRATTQCTVTAAKVETDTATVWLKATGPNVKENPFALLSEVASLEGHAAKVAKMTEVYSRSPPTTSELELHFIKNSERWLADYQLPEKAAVAKAEQERQEKATQLMQDGSDLFHAEDYDGARAKLAEAGTLAPDNADITKRLAAIDDFLKARIAAGWFGQAKTDAMTDRETRSVRLRATGKIEGRLGEHRPALVARCIQGRPDVWVNADTMVDAELWGSTRVKYRFGGAEPQVATMTASTDREAFFFSEPQAWMQRLSDNAASKLIIAIPLYGRQPEPVTFDLKGADAAMAYVTKDCPLAPPPKAPQVRAQASGRLTADLADTEATPETFCQCRPQDTTCRLQCAMSVNQRP